jgi:hypothetical protein
LWIIFTRIGRTAVKDDSRIVLEKIKNMEDGRHNEKKNDQGNKHVNFQEIE